MNVYIYFIFSLCCSWFLPKLHNWLGFPVDYTALFVSGYLLQRTDIFEDVGQSLGTWSTFSWFRRPPNCNNALSVLFTLIVCNRTTPVSKVHNSLYINWSRLPTNANLSLSLSLSLSLCLTNPPLPGCVCVCFLGAVIRLKVLLLKTVLPLTKALTSREVHSLFLSQSLSLCMFCISLFHSFTSLIGPFSCVGI